MKGKLLAVGFAPSVLVVAPAGAQTGVPSMQFLGDSRGRWEGNTLVVETANFNGKTAATNPGTNYQATVEDPTVWT